MDVNWFQFGDMWQMQNSADGVTGHCVVFVRNEPDWQGTVGKDVGLVWSSNTSYDNSWLTKNQVGGNGF